MGTYLQLIIAVEKAAMATASCNKSHNGDSSRHIALAPPIPNFHLSPECVCVCEGDWRPTGFLMCVVAVVIVEFNLP